MMSFAAAEIAGHYGRTLGCAPRNYAKCTTSSRTLVVVLTTRWRLSPAQRYICIRVVVLPEMAITKLPRVSQMGLGVLYFGGARSLVALRATYLLLAFFAGHGSVV